MKEFRKFRVGQWVQIPLWEKDPTCDYDGLITQIVDINECYTVKVYFNREPYKIVQFHESWLANYQKNGIIGGIQKYL